jgi:hypothetical protein
MMGPLALLTGCAPGSGVKDHSWWVYVGFFVCVAALTAGAAASIRLNVALPFVGGLVLVPLASFLFSYFALGQWDRFRFFFVGCIIGLLFLVPGQTHYAHETKSGAADRRFKDNPEIHEPDDAPEFTLGMKIGGAGAALGSLAFCVWVFFRAVPDISKLLQVATLEHLW